MARAAAQEISTTHIRKQANARLRHGHFGGFCDDAQTSTLANPHAATHDDAVHKSDVGLRVVVDQVVQRVFVGEKRVQRGITGQCGLVEETDVAAGAEAAKQCLGRTWAPYLVTTADGDRKHGRVVAPGLQRGQQRLHHRQGQGVERLGTVQRDQAYSTGNGGVYFGDIACVVVVHSV